MNKTKLAQALNISRQMLYHQLRQGMPLSLGAVTSLGELNESNGMDQDISIAPLMSGYRDKDTLKVNFVTYYKAVGTDLEIVIRQDQIHTATRFDFDAYNKLNPSDQLDLK